MLNGYEYVDLGLPSGLKWATMNVGATKPEGTGDKYAWGEIDTKTEYTSSNSTTYNKSVSTLKTGKVIDANGVLTKSNDVASQKWGDKWRMPTVAEYNELVEYCTWTWTKLNGVSGYKVASQKPGNQNWIFIPSSTYWSSTISDGTSMAYASYNSTNSKGTGNQSRYEGYSVRPVCGVKTYSVSFYDQNGNVIESHKVEAGKSAVAPAAPVVDGYEFTGWDKTFTNVQSDLIVTAQYKEKSESPVSGTLNGYEYVDLGLPSGLKWATMNVGATKPEEYGDYYDGTTVHTGSIPLENQWRCPTKADFEELLNNCTWIWSTLEGVYGYKVVSKQSENNWIFLPAAGFQDGRKFEVGSSGYYWSSTLKEGEESFAYGVSFDLSGKDGTYRECYMGMKVRPVSGKGQPNTYKVSFYNQKGVLIIIKNVEEGKDAVAPTVPEVDGYEFTGWDKTFTNVQSDLIVTAQYKEKSEYPVSGILNGNEYVDLGLPSGKKWATKNVGATTYTDNGGYYRGDSSSPWGTAWSVPSQNDFNELISNCTWEWVTLNEVSGYKISNKSDSSLWIFLPAAGNRDGTYLNYSGTYWTSTMGSQFANYYLGFTSSSKSVSSMNMMAGYMSIRLVLK